MPNDDARPPRRSDATRSAQIGDLRRFADILDDHPEVPIPRLEVSILAPDDSVGIANVVSIAEALGVAFGETYPGHFTAALEMPGGLVYRAVYVSHESMRAYHDGISYSANIAAGVS